MNYCHEPVAASAVVELMRLRPGAVVVDCCVGFGGHARLFLQAITPGGFLLGTDVDQEALKRADVVLKPLGGRYELVRANYAQARSLLAERGVVAADAVFLDLGVCSLHFDEARRGFSVWKDGPLDMRMDPDAEETAADIVNQWAEEDLARLFWEVGDERRSRAIARAIVERRRSAPIVTTRQLAALVEQVKGKSRQGIHAATKVFMALRIQVNRELDNLASILADAPAMLNPDGRIVVISYHSKEDFLVKNAFRSGLKSGEYSEASRKPISPSSEEMRANPRSRSARIRYAVKAR